MGTLFLVLLQTRTILLIKNNSNLLPYHVVFSCLPTVELVSHGHQSHFSQSAPTLFCFKKALIKAWAKRQAKANLNFSF